jgi:TonB family protein
LQVITEDHAPALISGHSAQKQLRDASRKLHEAEANASTDEDRNKIATAQQMLRMAQSELAEQSGQRTMIVRVMPPQTLKKLDHLNLQWKQLDDHALQIKLNDQPVHLGTLQADQQRKMLALQTKLNNTELQARVQQHAVDQIRVQVDAQIQDQVKEAQRTAKDSVMIAKLEPPMIFVEPQEAPKTARVSAGVMAGQVVTKTQPVYPQSAKDAKISGSVVLHAIIDETGKVEQLAVVSSPDKELSKSAIDAVQHWTYKPYLLNGRPTVVDTTITVNYSFAP